MGLSRPRGTCFFFTFLSRAGLDLFGEAGALASHQIRATDRSIEASDLAEDGHEAPGRRHLRGARALRFARSFAPRDKNERERRLETHVLSFTDFKLFGLGPFER